MAGLLAGIAKSYVAAKLGGSAIGGVMAGGGLAGGGKGGGITQESIGTSLGNLAAGSSGDTLSPHQFSAPGGGVKFYNRNNVDARKKKRMF